MHSPLGTRVAYVLLALIALFGFALFLLTGPEDLLVAGMEWNHIRLAGLLVALNAILVFVAMVGIHLLVKRLLLERRQQSNS